MILQSNTEKQTHKQFMMSRIISANDSTMLLLLMMMIMMMIMVVV